MGKPTAKKKNKKPPGTESKDGNSKSGRSAERGAKVLDNDAAIFIQMANEMKKEGTTLFQKRDYEGAVVKYEKAIKLLPNNHIDIACLHSNVAACYMQMGPQEYTSAIHECNLALRASPKYTKALLKRARCFQALHMVEFARKDVDAVLTLEPNNLTALDLSHKINNSLVQVKAIPLDDVSEVPPVVEETDESIAEMAAAAEDDSMKAVKLVFGEDIRFAQIPRICSISQLREIVRCRFPSLKAFLIKYKDREGDLITITTSEELRLADDSSDPQGSLFRFYVNEVKSEHDPLFHHDTNAVAGDRNLQVIDEWIVEFAELFKKHVGVDSDAYLDLHQLGMKLYSDAMEETVTSEEAMRVFDLALGKFQEMAALALFNRGNVHMSRARKRLVFLVENDSEEAGLAQVESSYEWAKSEYGRAGSSYEEAVKIKPDFYEGLFGLAHQQFEQAKLTWCFALGSKVDLGTWPSKEVLELFNNAVENMERAGETWEVVEEERFRHRKKKVIMEKMGRSGKFSADEAAESAVNMRTQVDILWGRILYERSTVEFKLSLPTWEESLTAAIEKFKLAGASPTDIAVIIKNHSSNEAAREGLGFKIDEIVQAWNEMHDAKRWLIGVSSFRLEPLFRRRVPKLHQSLEHARDEFQAAIYS